MEPRVREEVGPVFEYNKVSRGERGSESRGSVPGQQEAQTPIVQGVRWGQVAGRRATRGVQAQRGDVESARAKVQGEL